MISGVREIVPSATIFSSSMVQRKGSKGGGEILPVVSLRRNPRIVFIGGSGASNGLKFFN